MRKTLKEILAVLPEGASLRRRGSGHYVVHIDDRPLRLADGRLVVAPSTPSDHRALKNLRAQARRVTCVVCGGLGCEHCPAARQPAA